MNSRTKNTWGLILSVAFIAYAMSTHAAVTEKNLHAEKRNVVSLNGEWDAAIAADANSDIIPNLFDHKIRVPGHWPLLSPEADFHESGALWYRTTYRAPKKLPPRIILRIAKAQFGRTIYVNGKKADFYPYNFSSSETDISKYVKAGAENEIVVRVKSASDALTDGSPTAHNGSDYERLHYYPGIYDSVTIIESGWPAIKNIETHADLERGVVKVRATLVNGSNRSTDAEVSFTVGSEKVTVKGARLDAGEERQVVTEVAIADFDHDRDSWTPEHPKLFTVTAETKGDRMSRRFGMRTFKADSEKGYMLLNGEKRFLLGTNTDLFRFFDDPQCGIKPWDEKWMRQLFAEFKRVGWDSFRNCISAVPEMWYDLCDEMGLMIQDEYPFWTCGDRARRHECCCTYETILPEYLDWFRDRGTHPSIVIIDLQNESYQDWFRDIEAVLKRLDFQGRPFELGWTSPNPDDDDVREYHPYLYIKNDFTLGYLNSLKPYVTVGGGVENDHLPKIINEYGWNWINRNGDPTSIGRGPYAHSLPFASQEERKDYYAWSVGILTEYWRTRTDIAGIHHFTSLTYSFDEATVAATGDILSPDLTTPTIRPEVFERFKSAFAPVTVVVDDYLEEVIAGEEREIPIALINEGRDNKDTTREIVVSLSDNDGKTIHQENITMSAPAHGREKKTIKVRIPTDAQGKLTLTASMGDGIKSVRRWNVIHRLPDFALGKKVEASSLITREHGDRPAICATDGSLLTRWVSDTNDKKPWIIIDIEEKRQFAECEIAWFLDFGNVMSPESVKISGSVDGREFHEITTGPAVRTVQPNPVIKGEHPDYSTWQKLSFPQTEARYVKIEAEGALPHGKMSIAEVTIR